jgi:Arc/MetJ-type ribon-helix-helix transcriptional regulator
MHKSKKAKKAKIMITIDPDLLDWIKKEVSKRRFANRSHAIQVAVSELKKRGQGRATRRSV